MRNTEEMKLWLFDISHGNLTDTDILKGFIKYYVLFDLGISDVKREIHFHTNYRGEKNAIDDLKNTLIKIIEM